MSEIINVNHITQAYEILGIGKPKHPLVSVIHHDEINILQQFGEYKYVVNLYQIAFKDGVSGSIGYGRNSYDFHEGTLLFTQPGQVLIPSESENLMSGKGWMLIFHPDLISKSQLGNSIEDYSFFSYDVLEALHISEEEKKTLGELIEKIEKEYSLNLDKHSQKLIVSTLELLLDYCMRFYDRQFYTRANLNKDVISRFERLINDYYRSSKPPELGIPSVKYCSNELNLSANYLSDLLRKETGQNAQSLIQQKVIEKAKVSLLSTNEPISQIAYSLGFEYPNHFSKMFKSKTGMTPAEYRSVN